MEGGEDPNNHSKAEIPDTWDLLPNGQGAKEEDRLLGLDLSKS